MRDTESVAILGRNLPATNLPREALNDFAETLGHWPLLLGLVNAALVRSVGEGLSVADALAEVQEVLRDEGLETLDLTDDGSRETSVARTMAVAQKSLNEQEREKERYTMLGVFPEDVAIPIDVLAILWGTSRPKTRILCRRLAGVSLVQSFDASGVHLHDVIRKYLRDRLDEAGCRGVVEAFLGQVLTQLKGDDVWGALRERSRFMLEYLPKLLLENGLVDRAYEVVADVGYLEVKTAEFGRFAVEQDVEAVAAEVGGERSRVLHTVGRAIRRGSDRQGALESQLHTSMVSEGLAAQRLRGYAPLLAARHPPQVRDSAVRVFRGHSSRVFACAVLGDGLRIVSASEDNTLRVWDSQTGECLHILNGHSEDVTACAVLGDGERIVSASEDNTLRVWDSQTGECLHILDGHSNTVVGCAVLGDGERIVSASDDNTLRVWDSQTGECLHVLNGHSNWVVACAVLGDGERIVSAS